MSGSSSSRRDVCTYGIRRRARSSADFHEHAGSATQSVQYVQRLLEFDPLREHAHRHLMRLLAAGAAQRRAEQYQTCRRLLANKLGVAPEPETVQLAEQIEAHV